MEAGYNWDVRSAEFLNIVGELSREGYRECLHLTSNVTMTDGSWITDSALRGSHAHDFQLH